jgi:hypothetical protein
MKPEKSPEAVSEFQKFDDAMRKILSVSHEELQRREKEYKRQRKRRKKQSKQPAKDRP